MEQRVRELYRALAEGDRAALDDLLDPGFVGVVADGMPCGLGGRYEGATAMRTQFWGPLGRHFAVRAEPETVHTLDDGRVLARGRYRGTARSTGAVVDAAFTHVLRVVDGRITELEQVTDTARWNAALGPGGLTTVEYGVADGVATIRLNRPDAGNAIDPALASDLYEVATRATADPDVRAVLLCGAGRSFTAGGDLKLFATLSPQQLPDTLQRMIDTYHLALERLAELDAPVVVAVRGSAAGGGLGMVCIADHVVATPDSKYVTGYAAIGLAADGGTSWYLPRLVGYRRAQEMFLRNRVIGAQEALEWGLISEIVPDDDLDARAAAVAAELAAGPTVAYGRISSLLRQSMLTPLSEHLAAERQSMVDVGGTADAAEGIGSFIAKRRPRFQGR